MIAGRKFKKNNLKQGRIVLFSLLMLSLVVLGSLVKDQMKLRIVVFENTQWTIRINPKSLEITATDKEGLTFTISEPILNASDISNFRQEENFSQWKYKDEEIEVSFELKESEFIVEIKADQSKKFYFPVINQTESMNGFILPIAEGIYAPIDDVFWRNELLKMELDTTEGLTMPFFGVDQRDYILTYIATNRYNNMLTFIENDMGGIQTNFMHHFTPNNAQKSYGFSIRFCKGGAPVEPAKEYRNYLLSNGEFVTMVEKTKKVPKAKRLLGAVHGYLWGELRMTLDDVLEGKWVLLCNEIVKQANLKEKSPGLKIKELLTESEWKIIKGVSERKEINESEMTDIAKSFSRILCLDEFHDKDYFPETYESVSMDSMDYNSFNSPEVSLFWENSIHFYQAYQDMIRHPREWGYGYSVRMLNQLKDAGIDRIRLVHDLWDFGMIDYRPQVAQMADELGYLLGPYDSYNSIHDPQFFGTDLSWSTAQFDKTLFDKGIIINWNGEKKSGYMKIGGLLSPIASREWVEERVNRIMSNTPYNSYFIDCDAYGQVYDDYSEEHPSTQEEDALARIDRMKWISDTFRVVIGSEGGSAYAAPVIHVAEGVMAKAISFDEEELTDLSSPYYVGAYEPSYAPDVFFKQVPLKKERVTFSYDPKYRLPLNEIVFHDSFVSTNHYGAGTLKFSNVQDWMELTSILYMTPPMYHFNVDTLEKYGEDIMDFYGFFSPIHREIGFSQMTDFEWLSDDHLIQRTEFDEKVEIFVNFSEESVTQYGYILRPNTSMKYDKETKKAVFYSTFD